MSDSTDTLDLDVVVPVFNEQETLEVSIIALYKFLTTSMRENWRITIADNASTDGTLALAEGLAERLPKVVVVHLAEKGRGRALKQVWSASPARVLAYVDEDLSTDLSALGPLVAPLFSGHSDLAIGTRLDPASRVTRAGKREFISRSYNLLLRRTMGVTFSDAQCGFKAIRRDVALRLLPLVEDNGWFFDTELLILAERSGLRIHEVPVDWIDDPRSSVDLVATAKADLLGMARVATGIARGRIPVGAIYDEIGRHPYEPPRSPTFFGQVIRFGAVGVCSTAAYALVYLLLQQVMPAQLANFLALLVTTIGNTAANRRFTFGVRGSARVVKHQAQGLIVFGVSWIITAGSLFGLHQLAPHSGAREQLIVLTIANLVATVVRFVLLRVWVFRREARTAPTSATAPRSQPTTPGRDSADHATPEILTKARER